MNLSPFAQLVPVHAQCPSLADNTADLDRLRRAVAKKLVVPQGRRGPLFPRISGNRVPFLARTFRAASYHGYALVHDLPEGYVLADFFAARPAHVAAMAVDLGTTHIEATLLDLATGKAISRARCLNPQTACGDDILSRYHYARTRSSGKKELQQQAVSAVNTLAHQLAKDAGDCDAGDILAVAVAGNTAMTHFFLGLDTTHLCREPYIPAANVLEPVNAADIGLAVHAAAPVFVFPSIGSYFGGDLIAGIIATGLAESEKPAMLIDVGTNAEVVMGCRDWLIACAGAAGPAMEGGVTSMGMRAAPGAIEHVDIDPETGELQYRTVENQAPAGICGSGMIELMAGLYLSRVIDMRGRFRDHGMAPALMERLHEKSGDRFFVVATEQETEGKGEVVLTQIDLDALMRSKAAMYSLLTTLKNQVNVEFHDLERIYVAGAFGRHISPRHATILGMLPDISEHLFTAAGNTSLRGAEKALLHRETREKTFTIPGKITYLELNVNQEFMMRFSGAKVIPHIDRHLFPSVPIPD